MTTGHTAGYGPDSIECSYGATSPTNKRFVAIYAVPFDNGGKRFSIQLPLIRQALYDASGYMDDEANESDQRVRILCDPGSPLPTVFDMSNLAVSDASDNFTAIKTALRNAGFNYDTEKYIVFYDGYTKRGGVDGFNVGEGEWYNDDRASSANYNNGPSGKAPLFAIDYSDVDLGFPYWPTFLHEMSHTMGAVQSTAPHSNGAGHCLDEADMMCQNDAGRPSVYSSCGLSTRQFERYDCHWDDYFAPWQDPSSYPMTHWNIAAGYNDFVRHGSSETVLPPGVPGSVGSASWGPAYGASLGPTTKFFTFNMASGVRYLPQSTYGDDGRRLVADNTTASISDYAADGAALNEVCLWQAIRVEDALQSSHPMFRLNLYDQNVDTNCGTNGTEAAKFGVSALVTGTAQKVEQYLSCNTAGHDPNACIPNPIARTAQNGMACVVTRLPDAAHEVRFCSLHLIPDKEGDNSTLAAADGSQHTWQAWNDMQVKAVHDILSPKAASGTAIVIAGDWNATPTDLTLAGFDDQFADIDSPDNENTSPVVNTYRKIDNILLSDNNGRFTFWDGVVTNPTYCHPYADPPQYEMWGLCSDHKILKGTAVLRAQNY